MAGRVFVVSGDQALAWDAVFTSLRNQGFTVTPTSEWTAHAERGSGTASVFLGAFAGKQGRHVILNVSGATDPQGNFAITLMQGTSGMSGGLIGASQAAEIYNEVYNIIGQTFQNAGVILQVVNI